ncbi:MAG: site-2 protease family protein [Christensenellales bacterium]
MFHYINAYLSDPIGMLTMLALALPGRLLAISMHECAHAWMADRCGDSTARMLGRVTLNPFKHLDLLGTLMMVFVGFGWAKPVPVNPNNFRNYRRDDLLVSIAGVTTNLIMCIVGIVLMYTVVGFALVKGGLGSALRADELGVLLRYAPFMSDYLIAPVFGAMAGNAYTALMYFTLTNLVLAVFNMIPIPPLDGYHVLNDLFLKRPLFATPRAQQLSMGILLILMFSGAVSEAIGFVQNALFTGAGNLAAQAFHALGIF